MREVSEGPNEDKSQMGFCELKGVTLQHNEVFWGSYEATRYRMMKDPLRAQMRLLEGSMRSFTGQIRSFRGSFGLPEVLHGSLVGRTWHWKTKYGHNSFI